MDIAHERGKRLDRELKKPLGMANFRSVMEWQPRQLAVPKTKAEFRRYRLEQAYLSRLARGESRLKAGRALGMYQHDFERILPRHFELIQPSDKMQVRIGVKGPNGKSAHIHEVVVVVSKYLDKSSRKFEYLVTVERSNGERVVLPAECLKRPEANEVK